MVLTVALYPVFDRLAKALGGRPKLAATILTVANLLIIMGPAAWLGLGALEGARDLAGRISDESLLVPAAPESIRDWPLLGPKLYEIWNYASANLGAALHDATPYFKPLASKALSLAGDAGIGALTFVLSVVFAGFLFTYGPQLVAGGRSFLSRVAPEQSEHFVELASATIRAVSQGIIGVALVQALLSGIILKASGVPGAGLLTFAILVFAIIQVGATIVVLPVIIWIWSSKDFGTALLLTILLLIAGLLDNILKPLVMGRGLTTPTLVILIGVIGGMLAHGIVGVFIGPIILSVAWELMVAWSKRDDAAPAVK